MRKQEFSEKEDAWLWLRRLEGYPLVIEHSHGESPINGGFNGKIIYKWAIFHGYVK